MTITVHKALVLFLAPASVLPTLLWRFLRIHYKLKIIHANSQQQMDNQKNIPQVWLKGMFNSVSLIVFSTYIHLLKQKLLRMHNTHRKDLRIYVSESETDHNPITYPHHHHSTTAKQPPTSTHSMLTITHNRLSLSSNDTDLSLPSFSALTSPSATFRPTLSSHSSLRCQTQPELQLQQYAQVERILRGENHNLKMQNQMLLKEIHKLRQNNHRYRHQYQKTALEAEEVRLECEAQKKRADEMKEIIMSRLAQLQGKIIVGESSGVLPSECGSLLDALTLSESGYKSS